MLIACILAVALFAAESRFVGTWKVNSAKSKLEGRGMGTVTTVRYETTGDVLHTIRRRDTDGSWFPLGRVREQADYAGRL